MENILFVTQKRNDSIWICDYSQKEWLKGINHKFDFVEIYPQWTIFFTRLLNHIKNTILLRIKCFKYKKIYFTRDNPYGILIKWLYKNKKIIMCFHHLEPAYNTSKLCKKILKTTDYFIAISNFTKDQLINLWVNWDKIYVNYNWVSQSYFPEIINNFRDYKYILYVWTEVERKNLKLLLEIFSQVHKKYPELKLVKLWIVWTEREKQIFDSQIRELNLQDHVIVNREHMSEKDLRKWYSNAICYISLSKLEWFGLPIVEAMACWCPVIISDIPPFREICWDNQMIVQLNDKKWTEKSISTLVDNDNIRKIYSEKAIEISKNFDRNKNSQNLVKFISKI